MIRGPLAAATAALSESVEKGRPIGPLTSAECPLGEMLVVTCLPSARSTLAATLMIAARKAGSRARSESLWT